MKGFLLASTANAEISCLQGQAHTSKNILSKIPSSIQYYSRIVFRLKSALYFKVKLVLLFFFLIFKIQLFCGMVDPGLMTESLNLIEKIYAKLASPKSPKKAYFNKGL